MVKFRRSNKSIDTQALKAINIPQKDAIAIVPPKKVIKALYDYTAPTNPPHYLSFAAGDFLHVTGRENDEDWYEACNPMHGTRGLVPVKYFDTVGKTVRDSHGSTTSGASAPHDSGYAESTGPKSAMGGPMPGHRMSKSIGKLGGGAMVYGVVAYDFHAERPDELEAKEGEAIIVIAQSNPEWFVAKPITRLGGPGLIPVSFIEIKDMATGQTVTDTQEAINKAGIPRVEEWKKMAADYKNTSIALGQFSSSGQTASRISIGGLQQGMDGMNLGPQQNGMAHSRSPSNNTFAMPQGHNLPPHPTRAAVPRFVYADEKFHFIVECTLSDGSQWDLSRIYEDFYELQINLIKAFPEEAGQTGQPRTLPYMPGPVQFVTDKISEGRRENLDEYLHNVLRLGQHIVRSSLVCGFFSPRGGDYEVEGNALEDQSAQSMPPPSSTQRYSQASQRSIPYSVHQQQQQQQQASYADPNQQHNRQLSSQTAARAPGPGHFRNPSNFSQNSGSVTTHPPPIQRQMTAQSISSTSTMPPPNTSGGGGGGAALKVKVWFDRDTCVVVRMPPKHQFGYTDLYRKIVERRKLEYSGKKDSGVEDDGRGNGGGGGANGVGPDGETPLEIEYRDERDGEYYRLADDDELSQAVESCEKLTLVVREIAA